MTGHFTGLTFSERIQPPSPPCSIPSWQWKITRSRSFQPVTKRRLDTADSFQRPSHYHTLPHITQETSGYFRYHGITDTVSHIDTPRKYRSISEFIWRTGPWWLLGVSHFQGLSPSGHGRPALLAGLSWQGIIHGDMLRLHQPSKIR